jgi:hypothetical protein
VELEFIAVTNSVEDTKQTGENDGDARQRIEELCYIECHLVIVLTLILSEFFLLSCPSLLKLFYAAMLIPLMIARYILRRAPKGATFSPDIDPIDLRARSTPSCSTAETFRLPETHVTPRSQQ